MSTEAKHAKRNPFVALCDYASQNNWCWKLVCTTCGHGSFSVALSKLVHGLHPDDEAFWPNGKENHALLNESKKYGDFWQKQNPSPLAQKELATVVAGAKLSDIQAEAKWPDWLGYLGLVINHCPDRASRKVISDSLLPQFAEMLKDEHEISEYLKQKQKEGALLSINDLSRIESKAISPPNVPLPLIFDIL